MGLSELVEKLKSRFLIIGGVRISKDDGDTLETLGEGDPKMNDIGAFLGSAGEVIFNRLQMQAPDYATFSVDDMNLVLIKENSAFTILKVNGSFSGLYEAFTELSFAPQEPPAKEEPAVEETPQPVETNELASLAESFDVNKLGEIERKLLSAKIIQLNYLVEEFARGGSTEKWNSTVSSMISSMPEMKEALTVTNKVSINDIVSVEITREEIQAKTKSLIDGICKKAVEEYGAAEAKKMVQNVIEKLSKK
ncbi:MAG: hypothetical protein PHW02_07145 [bacterium]|nr:hypothetical protein [bacterium]